MFVNTMFSSVANHATAGLKPDPLNELNSGNPITLDDNLSAGSDLSPLDATWAMEWDLSLAPGQSVAITADNSLQMYAIPEPSMGLLLLAGFGLAGLRLRLGLRSRTVTICRE